VMGGKARETTREQSKTITCGSVRLFAEGPGRVDLWEIDVKALGV
jgi:hypothetical protein